MNSHEHHTEVVKRLFSPTPEKAATKRNPLHYQFWNSDKHNSFRTGLFGTLIFLLLCASAIAVTAKLNSGWTQLTLEGMCVYVYLRSLIMCAIIQHNVYVTEMFL